MKKAKLIPILVLIALLILGSLPTVPWLGTPTVLAHSITVDGDPSDWTMIAPTNVTTGHIGRDASLQGEYIWNDNGSDERTDFYNPDEQVDITEFRVTGDDTYLYFLIRMTNVYNESGNWAPMVQIAIDTDQAPSSGYGYYAGNADTNLADSGNAHWEYLVKTRFGSGSTTPAVYNDTTWTDQAQSGQESEAISVINEAIEIRVRWTLINVTSPATLRFTIASFRTTTSDATWDISGLSDALDAVTNYGNPGDNTSNTWDEVSDGDIDYYFDVYFDSSGEPYGPLLISEFNADTPWTEPDSEWLQVYNLTSSNISLDGWKVGTAETVDETGEDMYQFPSGYTIAANDIVIVANDADEFSSHYTCNADFDLDNANSVPDVSQYNAWATGHWALANSGDEILLLDPSDTIIDAVTWGNGSYPGVSSHSSASASDSLERYPISTDTNDCSSDLRTVNSNGTPCTTPTAVTLAAFTAAAQGSAILLQWETATELDNLGFYLYRAEAADEAPDGAWLPLGEGLIPTQMPGSPGGARYEFVDRDVEPGAAYYYWLEDVDIYGATTVYGPVAATVLGYRIYLPLVER